MTRPAHQKFHIGEHNPLKEGGHFRVVRRKQPLNLGTSPTAGSSAASPASNLLEGHIDITGFIASYPLPSFLVACGVGCLISCAVARLTR